MTTDQTTPDDEPAKGVVFPCERCGLDMPPLSEDLVALMRSAQGVTLAHDVCPGDEPPKPVAEQGRDFRVRVQIVEHIPVNGADDAPDEVVELMRFEEGVHARNLDAAMRPLAEALGVKWAQGEKNAKIADSDSTGPTVP